MNNSPAIKRDSNEFRRECEAKHVIKMDPIQREDFYKGVLLHRRQKGLDELVAEVKKQRKILAQSKEMER